MKFIKQRKGAVLKKYNIALLPSSRCEDFIVLSQKFSILSPVYQLGPRSLPHVTLCQFKANVSEIDEIWDDVCAVQGNHLLNLKFSNFSCMTFDNIFFWVSLVPNNLLVLTRMHSKILNIVKSGNDKLYDPHLTLIGTLDSSYERQVELLQIGHKCISDKFILSLGGCDEIGQFTDVIKQIDVKDNLLYGR